MAKRKAESVEDLIHMAVRIQARLAKDGVILAWNLSWTPCAELVKGRPEKDKP